MMMTEEQLTPLELLERKAMTGNRQALLLVVSALRQYRAACKAALDARRPDGSLDSARVSSFAYAVEEIEAE